MIFVHHSPFLDILPGKFQSIANIGTHDFGTFIPENLRPPLIFLVFHGLVGLRMSLFR